MEDALISINNPRTRGLPILNGDEEANYMVYPSDAIGSLPCTFLGTAKSPIDVCFFFAAGAVPAQENYDVVMGDALPLSQATIFMQRHASLADWDLGLLNVAAMRRANAATAVSIFFSTYRASFGGATAPLQQAQILCFGREVDVRGVVWGSRVLNLADKSEAQLRALLIPFCMSQEVDEAPEELSGNSSERFKDQDMTYAGFVLRLYSAEAMVENVPGFHHNYTALLHSMFIAATPDCTWVVKSLNPATQKKYFDIQDGISRLERDNSTLFWFQHLLSDYLIRHGISWADLWPPELHLASEPSTFITNAAWAATFANSQLVVNIIHHIRANRPVSANFRAMMKRFARVAISSRPLPGAASTGTPFPTHNPLRMNGALQENLTGLPGRLQALAVTLTPAIWRDRRPFRSEAAFDSWIHENAGYQDPHRDIAVTRADITAWPLWPFVLAIDPTTNREYRHQFEFNRLASEVMRVLQDNPARVASAAGTINALQDFRAWWIATKNERRMNFRTPIGILTRFMRQYLTIE